MSGRRSSKRPSRCTHPKQKNEPTVHGTSMSLNDPQWGRKGGGGGGGGREGPPDLDELWRNFNQRLSGLFGRRGGGGGGGVEPPSARQLGGGLGLLMGLIL